MKLERLSELFLVLVDGIDVVNSHTHIVALKREGMGWECRFVIVCYNLKRVVESIFLNAHQISNITKDEE
jgi:hypothetical protein